MLSTATLFSAKVQATNVKMLAKPQGDNTYIKSVREKSIKLNLVTPLSKILTVIIYQYHVRVESYLVIQKGLTFDVI